MQQRSGAKAGVLALLLYGLALPTFFVGALPVYSEAQRFLAWIVFVMGTYPLVRAYGRRQKGVPMLELVAAQYALLFALPVFYESRLRTTSGFTVPAEPAITLTIVCAALALAGIFAGYRLARRFVHVSFSSLVFEGATERLFVFAVASILGNLAIVVGGVDVPDSFAQPLSVILSQDLGVALLACLFYTNRLSPWQRHVAMALSAICALFGFAGGMIQSALQPLVIWILAAWILKRRRAVMGILVLGGLFFLLQPVKDKYRSEVWYANREMSVTERVSTYVGLLKAHWGSGENAPDALDDIQTSAADRLSWLMTTARYIDWTPSVIDYKHGETVLYLLYTWVPRFVWADKPIAQVANKVLPVEYGLQDAEGVDKTMFGVGHVAEAYVNFGLSGIIPIFLLLGVLYYLPRRLLDDGSTVPSLAIYIAIAVNMIYISTSIGQIFGGFVQQLIVQALLLRVLTGAKSVRPAIVGAQDEIPLGAREEILVGNGG